MMAGTLCRQSSHCGVVNKLKLVFLVAIILLLILIYASTRR